MIDTIEFNKSIVNYGESVSFSITPANSLIDLSSVVVKLDSTELNKASGVYTITSVTSSDLNIIVEGVKDIYSFAIDFSNLEHHSYDGYNGNYPNQFTLKLAREYNDKVLASDIIVEYDDNQTMTFVEFIKAIQENLSDWYPTYIDCFKVDKKIFIQINDVANDESDYELQIFSNVLTKGTADNYIKIEIED